VRKQIESLGTNWPSSPGAVLTGGARAGFGSASTLTAPTRRPSAARRRRLVSSLI